MRDDVNAHALILAVSIIGYLSLIGLAALVEAVR